MVITDPPVDAGAVNEAVSCPLPAVKARLVGAPGVVLGVPLTLAVAVPLPAALTARTWTL